MTDWYQKLAVDCANQAKLLRCVAAVHLEDENDEFFWKPILESVKAGPYHFIPHSKNAGGHESSGCTQCVKFKGFLNKNFFVCMDSDYRLLGLDSPVSATDFFAQTYTYSFENHFCYAQELQTRFLAAVSSSGKTLSIAFDFEDFLKKLSVLVFPILLHYLSMKRDGNGAFTKGKFNELFKNTFVKDDYQGNGAGIICKIGERYASLKPSLDSCYIFDLPKETAYYKCLGLTSDNAYLRMRGHTLYNLLYVIGNFICRSVGVGFEGSVLKSSSLTYSGYQEMDYMVRDVKQILL